MNSVNNTTGWNDWQSFDTNDLLLAPQDNSLGTQPVLLPDQIAALQALLTADPGAVTSFLSGGVPQQGPTNAVVAAAPCAVISASESVAPPEQDVNSREDTGNVSDETEIAPIYTIARNNDVTSVPIDYTVSTRRRVLEQRVKANGMTIPNPSRLRQYAHMKPPTFEDVTQSSSDGSADKENAGSMASNNDSPSRKRKCSGDGNGASNNAGDNSSSDGVTENNQTPSKRCKKYVIRDLVVPCQRLINLGILYFKQIMCNRDPFVARISQEADRYAIDAWDMANAFAVEHCDYSEKATVTLGEMDILKQRLSQYRGEIKTITSRLVRSSNNPSFRFVAPDRIESQNYNRELAKQLKSKESSFTFKNREPVPGESKGHYGSSLIDCVVNAIWFAEGLRSEGIREGFFPNETITLPALALVITAIENSIDEWRTGIHVKVHFSKDSYGERYASHLEDLRRWDAWSIESGTNLCATRCKELFLRGRAVTGVDLVQTALESGENWGFTADDFAQDGAGVF
ncbi:hypothetical protein AAF712_010391 [Marasmius tenuissimus]|uniref:DUF6532 domain-containing protein n=1 Tax=Marasmius tenuissimus TaxID=585030 RepID=A0ABR2ZM96_9AGAR